VEGVGFKYGDLNALLKRYEPARLSPGVSRIEGEEIFFISNPGLGLWAHRDRLGQAASLMGREETMDSAQAAQAPEELPAR
jgi:hypothetical protein